MTTSNGYIQTHHGEGHMRCSCPASYIIVMSCEGRSHLWLCLSADITVRSGLGLMHVNSEALLIPSLSLLKVFPSPVVA